MTRARRGFKARQRRNKILKLAKGFHFDRRTKFRHAKTTVERALHNAYKHRRIFKREIRSLWVVRISAAVKELGGSYSKFIGAAKAKGVEINRKMLAEVAVSDSNGFANLYKSVMG